MNIDNITESKYLAKSDVTPAVTLTISGITVENLAKDNEPAENKWIVHFSENYKPMVLNKTNAELIAHVTGSRETDGWTGSKVTLFNDPSISFGGKLTGGIRIQLPQAAAPISAAQEMDQDAQSPPF